ncbi:hypothetical protein, partial [Paraburkholderia fungorum]|uniref:hypothetical protein n=1 Tax=Paraburkholderia fungorum TaxID=134537 RepID=UPI00241FD3AF
GTDMKWHSTSLIRKLSLLAANIRRYDAYPASFLLAGGMKKVIFSLALGTFGLGMAEFGIMGVLTELARDVGGGHGGAHGAEPAFIETLIGLAIARHGPHPDSFLQRRLTKDEIPAVSRSRSPIDTQ